MKFKQATQDYEAWLRKHSVVVKPDLILKHQYMADDAFMFLRGTFYRWAQLWPEVCVKVADAPEVLAVGDVHIENYGTWRDVEGRLIWGINDFDEAYPLPYTSDLIRLATSANMAVEESRISTSLKDACIAILEGYRIGLESGGKAIVLSSPTYPEMRKMAMSEERSPVVFWNKMMALVRPRGAVPESALKGIEALMPKKGLAYKVVTRHAGVGSLGRQRFIGLAEFQGGPIAREAKAMLPSACAWANGKYGEKRIYFQKIIDHAVRCVDPFVKLKGRWMVRRLAPDCSRIDLSSLPSERDERLLLKSMGLELANVHLGTRDAARAILRDLGKREDNWLRTAAQEMTDATTRDWRKWREVVKPFK